MNCPECGSDTEIERQAWARVVIKCKSCCWQDEK